MAAFNFIHDNRVQLVSHFMLQDQLYVPIYLKGGRVQLVRWAGFRGYSEPEPRPDGWGQYGKMAAISVTGDNGGPCSSWRSLQPGEFVLSWITPYNATEVWVLTCLDKRGVPRVMGSPRLAAAG